MRMSKAMLKMIRNIQRPENQKGVFHFGFIKWIVILFIGYFLYTSWQNGSLQRCFADATDRLRDSASNALDTRFYR